MFDVRIRRSGRGHGTGTRAVLWLTGYLFGELPDIHRIEATTRRDNIPMRRVLRRCGYVNESHYRQAWPATDGHLHDSIGYAILREDWASGTQTEVEWHDEDARDSRT